LPAIFCALSITAKGQDTIQQKLSPTYLAQVSAKAASHEEKINRASEKALAQLQKREEKIRQKLFRIDSSRAKAIFGSFEQEYERLKQKLDQPQNFSGYIPYLDTLKTSLQFLQNNKGFLKEGKDVDQKLNGSLLKVKSLEESLQKANAIKAFMRERRAFLNEQLKNFTFSKDLKEINKQVFYYNAQINEYKEVLKDSRKLERKAIELLSRTKPFQSFMRKNSVLASLFRLPGRDDQATPAAALQGLQTRASISALLEERIGTDANAQEIFQENVRAAQDQLSALKDQALKHSSGSFGNADGDTEAPDFKPNTQKTKSFHKRLEYGCNIQSQRARAFFPATSDLGLVLGYKLNDQSVIGVGGSYKLGGGKGWNNIAISHQGVSLRTFIDYKLKGSISLSGGYEQNYRTAFASIDQLKDKSAWQSSGLLGLSKKYSINRKLKGNVQLLWDFLSYQQIPRTQALLFRVGYNLK
jgi:hypothetical protein